MRAAQQTPIMRIIQEGRVGDTDLPPRLWKIAACNPPECAANGSELEPPLANRICHLTWETDYESWERAMANGAAFVPPQFYPLPDDWEQHLPKYSALVAAFHKHLPGRLEKYPSERSKVSGPWPSIRSWTNGAICMAALAAIDAETTLRYRALAGCVGDDVALEYQSWESNLDLPDPEGWLALALETWRGQEQGIETQRFLADLDRHVLRDAQFAVDPLSLHQGCRVVLELLDFGQTLRSPAENGHERVIVGPSL